MCKKPAFEALSRRPLPLLRLSSSSGNNSLSLRWVTPYFSFLSSFEARVRRTPLRLFPSTENTARLSTPPSFEWTTWWRPLMQTPAAINTTHSSLAPTPGKPLGGGARGLFYDGALNPCAEGGMLIFPLSLRFLLCLEQRRRRISLVNEIPLLRLKLPKQGSSLSVGESLADGRLCTKQEREGFT